MDLILPITIIEEILSYLNGIDKHNAIKALVQDSEQLGTLVYSKMSFALDHRLQQRTLNMHFANIKLLIKELDLTGVHWIPAYALKAVFVKLVNLERLFLFGTSITFDCSAQSYDYFNKLKKIFTVRKSTGLRNLNENWLVTMAKASDRDKYEQIQSNLDKTLSKISYQDLIDLNPPAVEDFFRCFIDERAVQLNSFGLKPEMKKHISLEPLTLLTNLTTLHIDIIPNIGNLFLKSILQKCRHLKKLSLVSYNNMYHFAHIEYAQSLEELSIKMSQCRYFNWDKFFCDLNVNKQIKLRRVCLHITKCNTHDNTSLIQFLRSNPQLILLFITCSMTQSAIATIQSIFKKHPKMAHQVFQCVDKRQVESSAMLNHKIVPTVHWDLVGGYDWQ